MKVGGCMESILEVKHLSFSVGEKEILKDISFKIQKGDRKSVV